jgi:hypothetical protein
MAEQSGWLSQMLLRQLTCCIAAASTQQQPSAVHQHCCAAADVSWYNFMPCPYLVLLICCQLMRSGPLIIRTTLHLHGNREQSMEGERELRAVNNVSRLSQK